MAYRANPFLERMSERTTSDQDFVHLFSPKILEKLEEDCLEGAVHIFKSPPGGGKSTILRAFTPNALRAFWHAKPSQSETYKYLFDLRAIDDAGPRILGVMLSCAAGYADLPPGASTANEGLFRALLDCRIVMRTLKSLSELLSSDGMGALEDVLLEYSELGQDLKSIPLLDSPADLIAWAEQKERAVYQQLDIAYGVRPETPVPAHIRFESVLWLQAVKFKLGDSSVAGERLLMIDDLQSLRKPQRKQLLDELITLRPKFPVWLASRTIAFGDEFLSQGARQGRDVREYALEELWGGRSAQQFVAFAHSILDRRFGMQSIVPGQTFSQFLNTAIPAKQIETLTALAREKFDNSTRRLRKNLRYTEWLERARAGDQPPGLEAIVDLYSTRILIARDEANKQMSFELAPLSSDELEERE